jgi:hypothetical protein
MVELTRLAMPRVGMTLAGSVAGAERTWPLATR